MAYHSPKKIAHIAIEAGKTKAELPLQNMLVLGFLGGAFISIGYLLAIRVSADVPHEWGSFASFLGAAVFPLGLVLIVVGGAELLTGNMMALPIAFLAKRVTIRKLLNNWFWITISNFIGALFVAYVFGHLVGLTETGPYLDKTVLTAQAKVDTEFWPAFFSGIGCNWLVGLAVWLAYGADDIGGKIVAVWFPIMGFVAIGFQHIVANMFVIPAAIFAGQLTWMDFIGNFIPVYLGNAVGGAVFVAAIYWIAYVAKNSETPGREG